jgi:hypothetical protein
MQDYEWDSTFFDTIDYYAFSTSFVAPLSHMGLILRLRLRGKPLGEPLKVHLVRHATQQRLCLVATSKEVKNEVITDVAWKPSRNKVMEHQYTDTRSLTWLVDSLLKVVQQLNEENAVYDHVNLNCQHVMNLISEELFGKEAPAWTLGNSILGFQLSGRGFAWAMLLLAYVMIFGVAFLIILPSFSLPTLSNNTIPCEIVDYARCEFGHNGCQWPDMNNCFTMVRYVYHNYTYVSQVVINPSTVGLRDCYPDIDTWWYTSRPCCGLPDDSEKKILFCQLNTSKPSVVISFPTEYDFDITNLSFHILPSWLLVTSIVFLCFSCLMISCGYPLFLFIRERCPMACCDRLEVDSSSYFSASKSRVTWRVMSVLFVIVVVIQFLIFSYGFISGEKLAYIGMGLFVVVSLVCTYFFKRKQEAKQKNCTPMNFLTAVVHIGTAWWCLFVWARYKNDICLSPLPQIIPLLGLAYIMTLFVDYDDPKSQAKCGRGLCSKHYSKKARAYFELGNIAFYCAIHILLYKYLAQVKEGDPCPPTVYWTALVLGCLPGLAVAILLFLCCGACCYVICCKKPEESEEKELLFSAEP